MQKWLGTTVFLLTCIRLGWRLAHAVPAPPPAPRWQLAAATATIGPLRPSRGHSIVRRDLQPATGVQVVYRGLFPLQDLVPKSKALASSLQTVHQTLNFTLLGLVCLHAAAALKHHFVDRDRVLRRMLP